MARNDMWDLAQMQFRNDREYHEAHMRQNLQEMNRRYQRELASMLGIGGLRAAECTQGNTLTINTGIPKEKEPEPAAPATNKLLLLTRRK